MLRLLLLVVGLVTTGLWAGNGNDIVSVRSVESTLAREKEMAPAIQAVVNVEVRGLGAGTAVGGSGFYISPHYLLTAGHVVAEPLPASVGAATGPCTDKDCSDKALPKAKGAATADSFSYKIAACSQIQIHGISSNNGRTKPRTFKCRRVVFHDPNSDVAMMETFTANDNWMPLGTEAQISPGKTVDVMGYTIGQFFLHSRQCLILSTHVSSNFDIGHGMIRPGAKYFSTRCVSDHGVSGGLGLASDGNGGYSAIGVLSGSSAGNSTLARMPDIMEAHAADFTTATGDR